MANANLIKVIVTKIDSQEFDSTKASSQRWVNPRNISEMQIGNANGAIFRYAPPTGAVDKEYRTTTAASDIAVAANA